MSNLSDYSVTANLIKNDLLVCTLINDDLNYESKVTPECLKSGLINLKKLQSIIILNAKGNQQFYTIRINQIDSYNLVLDIMFSNDIIEFEEQINLYYYRM